MDGAPTVFKLGAGLTLLSTSFIDSPRKRMALDFGERVDPVDVLRSILDSYPFSIGLLREVIQNSDDAKATQQIFILDRRGHQCDDDQQPELQVGKGPSLVAYNDQTFCESDWDAVQTLHFSSKTGDSTKIGKYGIGFRSGYHVTDHPQIMSGLSIAYFDPLSAAGGRRYTVDDDADSRSDEHLQSFHYQSLPRPTREHYPGTIIRLPLREEKSRLGEVVTIETIRALFDEFIEQELQDIALFLNHICRIELHEIDEQGALTFLARVQVEKESWKHVEHHQHTRSTVTMTVGDTLSVSHWRMVVSERDRSKQPPPFSENLMLKHKMHSILGLAACLESSALKQRNGRLYTFLPLPQRTGFPVHVHALFALTQSRQHLRNSKELGLVTGSDDQFYVDWNQYLFDELLPETWAAFLRIAIENNDVTDIFELWPPGRNGAGGEESWSNLLPNLVTAINASNLSVWPVLSATGEVKNYVPVGENIVAGDDEKTRHLALALADAGIRVSCIPIHIYEAIKPFANVLQPAHVHDCLLDPESSKIVSASSEAKTTILEFLVTSGTSSNIYDLPLLPLLNGKYASLSLRYDGSVIYTLLEEADTSIFCLFDRQAIALADLPSSVANLLRRDAKNATLNVQSLDPSVVCRYISSPDNSLGLEVTRSLVMSEEVVHWTVDFWSWFHGYHSRDLLLPRLNPLYLVPAQHSSALVSTGIYTSVDIHPKTVELLQFTGFPMLHSSFVSEDAHQALRVAGITRSCNSLRDVITTLMNIGLTEVPASSRSALLTHILLCQSVSLLHTERTFLRHLPIFPLILVNSSTGASTQHVNAISDDEVVIIRNNECNILLDIPGRVYLDVSDESCVHHQNALLSLLQLPQPMAYSDLLTLAMPHLQAHHVSVQREIVEYILRTRSSLPPKLITLLGKTNFVRVASGQFRAPREVIDPVADISKLYTATSHPRKVPAISDTPYSEQGQLVNALSSLGVLKSQLTADLVYEYIEFLSSSNANRTSLCLAKTFLWLLCRSPTHFQASLSLARDREWLPTDREEVNLVCASRCRDDHHLGPRALFDRVLNVLEFAIDEDVTLTPTLRKCLGWESSVPIDIVVQQFERILSDSPPDCTIIKRIIAELSCRFDILDFTHLRAITADKVWIPTSSGYGLSTQSSVVLSSGEHWAILSHFFKLPSWHYSHLRERPSPEYRFYVEMGCMESVSSDALIGQIEDISRNITRKNSSRSISSTIALAEILVTTGYSEQQHARILIPDMSEDFLPISELFYNDVGGRSRRFLGNGERKYAHFTVTSDLATKLGIPFIGLNAVQLELMPLDSMEEKLPIRIRNTLLHYSFAQMLPEFLANASDARGTSTFQFLLDERPAPAQCILSKKMEPLQTAPSLILYNDGVFEHSDFQGLVRIGTGGKEGRGDTIGQFGSGALTMFHVTECPMIVSGDKVLFIDPCQRFLTGDFRDKNVAFCSLNQIARLYPDHLEAIHGLFGFDMTQSHYHGSIFRLPLRHKTHIMIQDDLPAPILDCVVYAAELRRNILDLYQDSARQSLLFVNAISSIRFLTRNSDGDIQEQWLVESSREVVRTDNTNPAHAMESCRIAILSTDASRVQPTQDIWRVATMITSSDLTPVDFQDMSAKYRLRSPIRTGLAYVMSDVAHSQSFFSTLPLPIDTTLPVNLSAPFILAPDRRSIRSDSQELKYNLWLLEALIPPLYLFLIEDVLYNDGSKGRRHVPKLWPTYVGSLDSKCMDLSNHVLKAFYNQLSRSTRRVFHSKYYPDSYVLPAEVALLPSRKPKWLVDILSVMKPKNVSDLSNSSAVEICFENGISGAQDANYLKNELLQSEHLLVSKYAKEDWDPSKTITECLSFLLQGENVNTTFLTGISLLPIADGTLAKFQPSSPFESVYHTWNPSHHSAKSLFDQDLIVDFRVSHLPTFRKVVKEGRLNLSDLTAASLNILIRRVIERQGTVSTQWLRNFWLEYPVFKVSFQDTIVRSIEDFPFVPTIIPGEFISIAHFRNSSVLVWDSSDPQLFVCFSYFGATIVSLASLPSPLRDILADKSTNFSRFLRFLASHVSNTKLDQFHFGVDRSCRARFVEWAQGELSSFAFSKRSLPYSVDVVRRLPIWTRHLPNDREPTTEFTSAEGIDMLPRSILVHNIKEFLSRGVVSFDGILETALKVQPMTLEQVWNSVQLPAIGSILNVDELRRYKRLIRLQLSQSGGTLDLLLPNRNSVIVQASALYAQDVLFINSLSDASFLHDDFRDIEGRFPLKREHPLSPLDFVLCVSAIDNDFRRGQHHQLSARAKIVFGVYSSTLPLRATTPGHFVWEQLSEKAFIPRDIAREDPFPNIDFLQYVEMAGGLPRILRPSQVVLPKFQGIAWSQRCAVDINEDSPLILVHRSFGTPTVEEVIRHLHVLALKVAINPSASKKHLLEHLSQTYAWLQDNVQAAGPILVDRHAEKLFLNVDDAANDKWDWRSADELCFNVIENSNADAVIHPVKEYLISFSRLLKATGVHEIQDAAVPQITLTSVEQRYNELCTSYEDMRRMRSLTDVVFVASDSSEHPAHRSFLAANGSHFKNLFRGDFVESSQIAGAPVKVLVKDFDGSCVGTVVAYSYTREIDQSLSLSTLLHVMNLSHMWELKELNEQTQKRIIASGMIRPETFEAVREMAMQVEATHLVTACEQYWEQNRTVITRHRDSLV